MFGPDPYNWLPEDEVQLLGLDLLELDGDDLRGEPLDRRRIALARLLRRKETADCLSEPSPTPPDWK